MNRRSFLAGGVVGVGGLVRQGADSAGPPRAPGGAGASGQAAGDRLFNPSAVQERAAATEADNDAEIQSIERRLKCTCGCNLDIYTCRTTDFACTYSPALHREVLDLRRADKTAEEVIEAFVAKHGEQVLMSPKPQGFNLAGYLVPGAVLLVAGGLLAAVLLRRSRMLVRAAAGTVRDPDMVSDAAPAPGASNGRPRSDAGTALAQEDAERLRRALAEVED